MLEEISQTKDDTKQFQRAMHTVSKFLSSNKLINNIICELIT